MAKLTSILQQRFLKKEAPKMAALAEQSSEGNLSSFAGIFGTHKLSEKEQEELVSLLNKYAPEGIDDFSSDLDSLISLTAEVRAINNQAALLHGERIKRAQLLLKKYRDGAFTAWLLTTYGNRQTPYNFLQYYEFYSKIPKPLQPQIEAMPRQAIYTLASRDGAYEKKEEIVRGYQGESKQELLALIRSRFPLDSKDQRRENPGDKAIIAMKHLLSSLKENRRLLDRQQKSELVKLADLLRSLLD